MEKENDKKIDKKQIQQMIKFRLSHIVVKVKQVKKFSFVKLHVLGFFNFHLHVWVSDGLLSLMIKCQTILDSLVQCKLWFICDINVLFTLDSQDLIVMVNFSMHDTVSQGFSNDELNIFSWNVKFLGNVF